MVAYAVPADHRFYRFLQRPPADHTSPCDYAELAVKQKEGALKIQFNPLRTSIKQEA
jgi:hypothetical protein